MKIEKKINNKKNIWKIVRKTLIILVIIISFSTVSSAKNEYKFPNSTPLQNTIKQEIDSGNISVSDIEGTPEYSIDILEKNDTHIKLKSTTKITFKNARGAGYSNNKWPKFEVKDDPELRKNGKIIPGDYDQTVKDYIASNIQNITDVGERATALNKWNEYNFESGPRTHIIEETYEVTYPDENQMVSSFVKELSISNDILMGFTLAPPRINWIVEDRLVILFFEVYYYKAGFELDRALGLRLPVEVSLNTPNLLIDGQDYFLSTSINGKDWDGARYSLANVPAENGNEFVTRLKFFLGVNVRIAYVPVISWYLETDKDYGRSFRTPIGINEEFPIPDLLLTPIDTGLYFGWSVAYLGIGLRVNPDLGTDKIIADWNTNGDSIGSGSIRYSEPNTNYNFGPVNAGDYSPVTEYANIRLSNYKYYFSQCSFETTAYVRLHLGWTSFGRDWDFPMAVYVIDCSGITGGLYLGPHPGTNADNVNENILVGRGSGYYNWPILPARSAKKFD